MEIIITDIANTKISGTHVSLPKAYEKNTYREDYFVWSPMPIVTSFLSKDIMMGVLEGWHHTPTFDKIEYHADKEMFYFMSGIAIMCFMDLHDGMPALDTAQIVRIPAGTELEIEAGKAHFVAVAENDHFSAIVTSPVQEAPRLKLPEIICGK